MLRLALLGVVHAVYMVIQFKVISYTPPPAIPSYLRRAVVRCAGSQNPFMIHTLGVAMLSSWRV